MAWILLLLLGGIIHSCSTDNGADGGGEGYIDPDRISFNITRALSTTDIGVGATIDEMIYDWTIVIVDAANNVEARLTRSNFNGIGSTPVEAEEVRISNYKSAVKLTNGAKRIYTFVNMSVPALFAQATVSEADANALTYTMNGNGYTLSSTNRIPMSSVIRATLDDMQVQLIDIPVKRLLAKLKFEFSNLTATQLTVTNVKMKNITQNGNNNIFLFEKLASGLPTMPASATIADLPIYNSSGIIVAPNNSSTMVLTSYINESPQPNYVEYIGFTVTTNKPSESSELRYALTDVKALYRNDYLIIPVAFTSYQFKPKVDFYPPIGGYAQAEMTSDANEVFYCTFKSGGQFVLRPEIFNNGAPVVLAASAITLTTTTIDGTNVLNGTVSVNPVDGWWTGMLTGNAGRVLLTLNYQVTEGSVTFLMERKVYIIVQP